MKIGQYLKEYSLLDEMSTEKSMDKLAGIVSKKKKIITKKDVVEILDAAGFDVEKYIKLFIKILEFKGVKIKD